MCGLSSDHGECLGDKIMGNSACVNKWRHVRPGIEYILHGMNIIPQVTNLCLGLAEMMKRPLIRL